MDRYSATCDDRLDYSLYVITTNVPELNRTHLDVARSAIAGGATVIQFRKKEGSNRELLQTVYNLKELVKKEKVPLIVNDRVDIAQAMNALGVHLGQSDMPPYLARKILGDRRVLGLSATNLKEALQGEKSGADYLGVGPIFPTPSKDDAASPMGLDGLAEVKEKVKIPLVAIGGVTLENVSQVIEAGADGVAVISAVAQASDMKKATQELLTEIKLARKKTKGA